MVADTTASFEAIARIPSGAAIIAARSGQRVTGMLASWIQQASFSPPLITVAIRRGRYIEELLAESGRCAVSILPENPSTFLRHFGRGFKAGEDAFAGLVTLDSPAGPLLDGCAAHLICDVRDRFVTGDHHLYVVEVVSGAVADPLKPYVHQRRTAANY